jgi:hypothetical protein
MMSNTKQSSSVEEVLDPAKFGNEQRLKDVLEVS